MRFLFSAILIALLSAVAEYFLPWWSMAVVCFIVALFINERKVFAFWSGFCGVAVCWLAVALWHDIPNEHILSSRMAILFHLPGSWLFMAASVLIGAVVGGLAALSGAMVRPKR
ncbi:MAG: hypothetical protein K0Q79_3119 [Flavipsychrobacter sp.]|jgi:hypothetical protein|nr:hypothetical protein [Flavipsychrobacter sp.]